MNESTYTMAGDYGEGETLRRREIRRDHNDGLRPHSALKAREMNDLMKVWRPKPPWYRKWEVER